MVAPSKKLTVSFGAFACTLEGFDDPFPVMRQVVDYFQALASADPSFGAHPERPDTDYLKTLAQESAGGTVEAELSEGGMILRQSAGAEVVSTLEAVEEPQPQETSAPIDPDSLMEEVLAEARFEDVDTLLEQSVREPQFEDVLEEYETEDQTEDLDTPIAQSPEDEIQGASLPDWAQDLIEDAIEHGNDVETDVADPIAEEEAALERVLKVTQERTQATPQLDRANPLAQLRSNEETQVEDITFEGDEADFDQVLAQEMAQLEEPDLQTEPVADTQADAAPTSQDVDDIFRAFAGTQAPQEQAPVSAAEILRQEVEREAQSQQTEAPKPLVTRVLTAAASTKANGKPMRLTFDGAEGTHDADQSIQDAKPDLARRPIAHPPEEEAPLVLTKAQVVEPRSAAPETPALMLVPEYETSIETDANLGNDLNTFAASVGADTLPELLEASAAYVTLVAGRSTFSRRDIMTLLDEMCEPNEFTQEARIKSFGRLLRGGSILRTEDGHFAISDRALNSYEAKAGVA